jgi:hypothetical protein
MLGNEKLKETLNDLILIHNDRIEEYEKAIKSNLKSENLSLFRKMISQSNQFRIELISEIKNKTNKVDWKESFKTGKIYKYWKDTQSIKSIGSAINDFFEHLEDTVIKAYNEALSADIYIPSDSTHIMIMQKAKLKESYELLHGKKAVRLQNS